MNQVLTFAGRELADARDSIRRYCGLPWSGGPPEVWAYSYFDAQPSSHRLEIRPDDVLAVAAVHPGLSRPNLAFFIDSIDVAEDCLAQLPDHTNLSDADEGVLRCVEAIDALAEPGKAELSLLSKVLHRKRPRLVPMLDRALVDWYRGVTGTKGAEAWRPLVRALHDDLAQPANRAVLEGVSAELGPLLAPRSVPSSLRLADIAIWMEARR